MHTAGWLAMMPAKQLTRANAVMNPIVYAIPVFFGLMLIEAWIGWRRGVVVYRLSDAVSSIGLGTLSQALGLISKAFSLGIYVLAFEHLRLLTLPADSVWVWLLALLIYDFFYYWHHRLGHEVAGLWAAHVVHHQSEEYNLSTALRQTSSGFLFGWLFYLPMALMGVPPLVFVVVALIDLLYQYWIHTEQIGRLAWFDRVFASPSNHRVHHAVNDRYLDRNYGGILILWDRIFGTFEEEDEREKPVYGTRAPLRSLDPVRANLQVYGQLLHDSRRTQRWSDKLKLWLKPPGWQPPDLALSERREPFDLALARDKYSPEIARPIQIYVLAQFAMSILVTMGLLALSNNLSSAELIMGACWVLLSLWNLASLQERGRWWAVEHLRLVALTPLAWLLQPGQSTLITGTLLVVAAASLIHATGTDRACRSA